MARNTFDAVAFDLDGTLYPNYRLNIRIVPSMLRELPLFLALRKARNILHGNKGPAPRLSSGDRGEEFYNFQARLMASRLGADPAALREKIDRIVYRGWEPFFKDISPFSGVRESLAAIRSGGRKLGVLSDFPPEKKLEHLGLGGVWDAVLCSELTGSLKPAGLPFAELARGLGCRPERILYVGNSRRYDIRGAKQAGMKAALVSWPFKRNCPEADFVFSDYRKLAQFVLS
ncbi:MAG: HAD family hydrolase [Treponema sp.]|jgi:putative hydrolase of the HAD superfamily|nr:HAD family hydrolase [Treponema sp.]